ncbi:hypothetical protein IFM89_026910 [Coptis chinensis]|uniref:Uncharacterized protein n=1 Tax=Coptis chinensis TaxID=261450 RepID=A0A835IXV1_9MAGN|nr:hypothetical protein IFM89_026910 [Coptis chinensis]
MEHIRKMSTDKIKEKASFQRDEWSGHLLSFRNDALVILSIICFQLPFEQIGESKVLPCVVEVHPTSFSARHLKVKMWLFKYNIQSIKDLLENSCNLETHIVEITKTLWKFLDYLTLKMVNDVENPKDGEVKEIPIFALPSGEVQSTWYDSLLQHVSRYHGRLAGYRDFASLHDCGALTFHHLCWKCAIRTLTAYSWALAYLISMTVDFVYIKHVVMTLPSKYFALQNVKALHVEDMDVVVEPGIGWMDLNEYLEPYGLFFPLYPVPIFVAMEEALYLHQPWPSIRTCLSLSTIFAGSVLYVLTDYQFTLTAYSWALAYLISMTQLSVFFNSAWDCSYLCTIFGRESGVFGLIPEERNEKKEIVTHSKIKEKLHHCSLQRRCERLEEAYSYVGAAFRSLVPIFVAMGEALYLHQPWPSIRTWLSLSTILAGSVLYVLTDYQFTLTAYSWALAYLISMTVDFVYIKHVVMTVWT